MEKAVKGDQITITMSQEDYKWLSECARCYHYISSGQPWKELQAFQAKFRAMEASCDEALQKG